ncbi:hypothetical protein SDC9_163000 [bioreactor metagenome]|uniref:Uncharacterized protein n=1 Tax=bioreactor metagenome TaxID=1076179 RepID=A0A645FPN2_9ZZZZ
MHAFRTGNALKALVACLIKRNLQLVGNPLPCRVVIARGVRHNPVQIKNDRAYGTVDLRFRLFDANASVVYHHFLVFAFQHANDAALCIDRNGYPAATECQHKRIARPAVRQ